MKVKLKLLVATLALSSSQIAYSEDDIYTITDRINTYGLTECNNFIQENLRIGQNWSISFLAFSEGLEIAPGVKVITVNSIFGTYGDSIKILQTYMETPTSCALYELGTITYDTTCQEAIDPDWTLSSTAPGTDYVTYETPTGVDVFLKNNNTSNGVSCVADFQRNISQQR